MRTSWSTALGFALTVLSLAGAGCTMRDGDNDSSSSGTTNDTTGTSGTSGVCGILLTCGDACVNPLTDTANCGGCGKACEAGELCSAGSCQLSCQQGLTNCRGICTSTQLDRQNCGTCGHGCAAGEVCSNSQCVLSCQQELHACNGNCVNQLVDNNHCGDCTTVCSGIQQCVQGICEDVCPVGLTPCDGRCVSVDNDPSNCGGCNVACTVPAYAPTTGSSGATGATGAGDPGHRLPVCFVQTCGLTCGSGWQDCDGHALNGCESFAADDPNHCGICGNQCISGSQASPICGNGTCGIQCLGTYLDCNNDLHDCESDSSSDPNNCGGCNNLCPTNATCAAGSCYCASGLVCGATGSSSPGLCAPVDDPQNCGTCGNVCQGATAFCSQGTCLGGTVLTFSSFSNSTVVNYCGSGPQSYPYNTPNQPSISWLDSDTRTPTSLRVQYDRLQYTPFGLQDIPLTFNTTTYLNMEDGSSSSCSVHPHLITLPALGYVIGGINSLTWSNINSTEGFASDANGNIITVTVLY